MVYLDTETSPGNSNGMAPPSIKGSISNNEAASANFKSVFSQPANRMRITVGKKDRVLSSSESQSQSQSEGGDSSSDVLVYGDCPDRSVKIESTTKSAESDLTGAPFFKLHIGLMHPLLVKELENRIDGTD